MSEKEFVDIGDDHEVQLREWEGEVAGLQYRHKRPDGTPCEGWIHFKGTKWAEVSGDREGWTLHSLDPLTLSPSLLCRACGDHGFIRDGKWVKA